jgi:hypothetical protein
VQYGKVARNSISVPLGVLDHAEESAQPSHRFNVIDDLETSNRFCLYGTWPHQRLFEIDLSQQAVRLSKKRSTPTDCYATLVPDDVDPDEFHPPQF